jgi:excisionase family DNA binding protein
MNSRLAYTILQTCDITGLGRTTVYEMIAKGELRALKCGRRTLILAEEIRRFLDRLPPIQTAA